MACGVNFSDSSTVTWSIDAAGNVVATAVGGGGTGGCCNLSLTTSFDQNTGVLTTSVTDSNGTVSDTVVLPTGSTATPCTVAGPTGLTGTQTGHYIFSCSVVPMPASGSPYDFADPALFPEWWVQGFTDGTTGNESWIVLADTNGVLQWHRFDA